MSEGAGAKWIHTSESYVHINILGRPDFIRLPKGRLTPHRWGYAFNSSIFHLTRANGSKGTSKALQCVSAATGKEQN